MLQRTIREMMPFIVFFNGQVFTLAAVHSLTTMNGEDYYEGDGHYAIFGNVYRSYLKTIDFTQGKDEYRFITKTGSMIYVIGLLYLNIVVLNLVIAITGTVYEKTMANKDKSELRLKS